MQVDLIFKVGAIGLIVAVLCQVLTRAGRDEQATMVMMAGILAVFLMLMREFSDMFDLIKSLFGM